MKRLIVTIATVVAAHRAEAGELAVAIAKADSGAVEKLRGQRDDVAARCTLGAVYAKRGDLSRAQLYFDSCADAELPPDISAEVARLSRDVTRRLRAGDLSPVVVQTTPDGLTAEISALPGDTFTTPATIWVKAGTYEVRATTAEATFTSSVSVRARSRALTVIDTSKKPKVLNQTGKVDFSHDGAAETQESGPPPDVQRGSLVPKKYRPTAAATEPTGDDRLEDPLAARHAHIRRAPRDLWLGIRVGAGMFDDGSTSARVGGAVAAATRFQIGGRYFLAGRFDWSRRGGEVRSAIDVLGASAGAGATLVDGTIGVALIAQLRGDLRFSDAMSVNRIGASAAANLELTLPSTPITAGIRFEQGLTELAPNTRDRAVLVELGVDWR